MRKRLQRLKACAIICASDYIMGIYILGGKVNE